MIRIFIIFILLDYFDSNVFAFDKSHDIQYKFESANKNYKNNNYQKALQEYEEISNENNGYIYYNLGNTYIKLNKNALALSNLIKAQKLLPRNQNINKNINYTYDKLGLTNSNLNFIFNIFSFKESYILLALLWLLILAYFVIKHFTKYNLSIYKNIVNIILIPIFFYFIFDNAFKIYDYIQNKAIVITQEAEVKISTNVNDITLFKIKEGQEVKVLEQIGDWVKISYQNNKGWLSKSSIDNISIL
ncbi:MAG: SH3 domain-containing protein [Candidatus Sericytochromatia bacterium]